MADAAIPVLSLKDPEDSFARRIGQSFREFGFAMVRDHAIDPGLISSGWDLCRRFFDLPETEKHRYHIPGQGGARGYTPFGTEIAKGAQVHDLKEFWHIGRDIPPNSPLRATMPDNIWPQNPEGFEDVLSRLFFEFDRVGAILLSRIAVHLGLDKNWFEPAITDGNSVLRLLHYPPVADAPEGAVRAGAHEDINLITLLLGAEESGLELLGSDGIWRGIAPPDGAIVVNIGDMLQRLTNHVLPSTTHRVRNPEGAHKEQSRYSMPFFVHLRSDFEFRTLECCISQGNPDRYPKTITADAYLQDRLREIGLRD